MAYPIPGVGISTPYGKRGSNWSCQKDSNGNGIHTGVDFACNSGTDILAPIDGQIRHRNYGSAFGNHQFAISPDKGQKFGDGEVFFAHTTSRPADGVYVKMGDKIADVGTEGNVTGPHLHFEFHPDTKNTWNCSVIADPQPVLDYGASSSGGGGSDSYPKPKTKDVYLDKLKYGQKNSDSVYWLQTVLNSHKLSGGATLPLTGNYLDQTDSEVRKCQTQHGYGKDPAKNSYVGPEQADHLFPDSYEIHQHS